MKQLTCYAISAAACCLILTGCSTFTPASRPQTPVPLPDQFVLYTPGEPGPGKWWTSFGSTELDAMVDRALSENFDIRTALARVRQAEATARKAGADLSPSLSATSGVQKEVQQTKTDGEGRSSQDSKSLRAGLSAAYELDLWGRLSALHTADLLSYQASREDLDAAAVTVASDVVTAWVNILSFRQQIDILKKQIHINERMLELQKLRFINGQTSTLDVSQQREALAQARAGLPPLELSLEQQLNALSVLLGRAGSGGISVTGIHLPELIPLPSAGLPADLLASRPDVRAAGLRLKEADWQVSAARADRLPSLTLSADAAFSSQSLDLLLSNWVTTLAASVTGPLFDGGRRVAEVDRARAEADEYLADYARTVSQAVQEVEDALVTEKRQGEYITLLADQLRAARLTVKDAHLQYMNGQDNYLSYLTAWTGVQSLERQIVDEQASLIKNRVSLYRALGGDFSKDTSIDRSK